MLTISSGTRSASPSASSVLPHAVGPVMQTHSTPARLAHELLPAQEQPIEILERDRRSTSAGRDCTPRCARCAPSRAAAHSSLRSSSGGSRAPRRGTPSSPAARCVSASTRPYALPVGEIARDVAHQRLDVAPLRAAAARRARRRAAARGARLRGPPRRAPRSELLDEIGLAAPRPRS